MSPKLTDQTYKSESKRITIDPVTRLEGHGKLEIFLDDEGNAEKTYWQIPELRGFEKFSIGRSVDEMNKITPRLCGVCPGAHHICSTKALDQVYKVEPPEAAVRLRELFYSAHFVHSHAAHFYALAAADFVVGPAAPVAERNILGVVDKVGLEVAGKVLRGRSLAQKTQEIIGGKATHPVCGIPGGMSKPISEDERAKIEGYAEEIVEFGKLTLGLLEDAVLKNEAYLDLIKDENIYYHETYYMGMVDKNNKVNFYDGDVRVVDPSGKEFAKFKPEDYLDHIGEHTEPWSYQKFPFLKNIGWKGIVDGPESGIYRAAPLARLNASEGFTTPIAHEQYEAMMGFFKDLGVTGPIHHTLVFHWARVIELMHAAEKMMECIQDPIITSKDIKNPVGVPGEGIGVVEAPRGILFHHYVADEEGIVQDVNLIVGTTNNNGPINLSVDKAAKALIKNWQISPGILNQVEMAFRAYDPCNSCATHTLPGKMPIKAVVRNADGSLFRELKNF